MTMENYRKGKNEEQPLERTAIPLDLPEEFLWMQVRGGSKIRNLLEHALKSFEQSRTVVWTGAGPSVGKTITCAEIMKREYKQKLHQITKICYKECNEYWDPAVPELDRLVVKRKQPMIHICLSIDSLNDQELGYQAPGDVVPYKSPTSQPHPNRQHHKREFNRSKPASNRNSQVSRS
ncbi:hypothetical protein HUJ04_002160 [Dendroctonus ponderosae]